MATRRTQHRNGQSMRRKRGNNEGSIRQRADGVWEARVSLPDGRRKSLYGKTRAEVARKLTEVRRTVDQGLPVSTGRVTVAGFLTRWLEDAARPSVRASTYAGYRNVVHNHIIPAVGRLSLEKLTPQDVQKLLNDRAAAGLSPRTVQFIRAVLRRALGQAVKWRMLAYNAAQLVDPPKQRRFVSRVWTPEQTRLFLQSVEGERFAALYTVAAYLGLRQGEILALCWQDVDFERRTLRVSGTMPTVGERVVSETKTERSRRTLPLPDAVATALRLHRQRQLERRLAAGESWQDHDLVFANIFGGPVERKGLHYRFKQAISRAGVPNIRFHDLRHGCATFLLAQGVPARAVMDILGHSSIKTTMDLYAHVMPHLLDDAAAKMNALLTAAASD
jgi:integrase